MVTAAQADNVIAENKVIYEDLIWRVERNAYRLTAAVICETPDLVLTLHGTIGEKNRSFALLYGDDAIRSYTVHDRHRDPETRIVYREPHKHYWHDAWKDDRVYIPDDIRIGDPNEELVDFLRECNIFLINQYSPQSFPFPLNAS